MTREKMIRKKRRRMKNKCNLLLLKSLLRKTIGISAVFLLKMYIFQPNLKKLKIYLARMECSKLIRSPS